MPVVVVVHRLKNFDEWIKIFKADPISHVCCWHKADVRKPPVNVCFRSENGRHSKTASLPLLTPRRHSERRIPINRSAQFVPTVRPLGAMV
jgi:hypothetical protein